MVLLRGRPRAPNQMPGQEPASQDVLSRITVLIEDARAQHARVDTKASVLLGATGTLLAVVIAVLGVASKTRPGNPGLPITVLALAWVGATLLGAALAHLAWTVRPMHTARGGGSPTDSSLLRAFADGPFTAVDHIRRELAGGDEAEIHRQMVPLGPLGAPCPHQTPSSTSSNGSPARVPRLPHHRRCGLRPNALGEATRRSVRRSRSW
jgi:hypothetical protein